MSPDSSPFVCEHMKKEQKNVCEMKKKNKESDTVVLDELGNFSIDVKKDIVDIINDSPSLVRLGEKDYVVKNMRLYSIYRIFNLAHRMIKSDKELNSDKKILSALCTDINAMCEVVAIILCNHLFTAEGARNYDDIESIETRNDRLVKTMKAKVMNSTFDTNQWAAIIVGALKSIDLGGFFLLTKSVNTLMDSMMERKKKSVETALQFSEAQSLQMPRTS